MAAGYQGFNLSLLFKPLNYQSLKNDMSPLVSFLLGDFF